MHNDNNCVVLIILDGWGIAPAWGANAISQSHTPNIDRLWRQYPRTVLEASGHYVGLPGHEQGNSEVGHLNIGTGRIVVQDSSRISQAIEDKSFFTNKELVGAINHCKKNNSNLHLMGLLSTGRIHAHIDHLFALLDLAKQQNFNRVYIHLFTDGRDNLCMSALEILAKLENKIRKLNIGAVASVIGRYFAMDRDNHWERTIQAYNLLVAKIGETSNSPAAAISTSYKSGITDEYIKPHLIKDKNQQTHSIKDNDSIIFYNFRVDRARQLTQAFTDDDFKGFKRRKLNNLFFVSLIPYGIKDQNDAKNIHSAFEQPKISNCLAEVIAKHNMRQWHIAETEKYAHVTYFFNGGQEKTFPQEERKMIPSLRVATYDLKPEMSADIIKNELISKIKSRKYQFIAANFANCDMVAHSGNFRATVKAIEKIDQIIGSIFNEIYKSRSILLITADHGNAEEMINPQNGEMSTQHTNNPVPFILINWSNNESIKLLNHGILADIAPTILELLHISKPIEMTGKSLIANKKNI